MIFLLSNNYGTKMGAFLLLSVEISRFLNEIIRGIFNVAKKSHEKGATSDICIASHGLNSSLERLSPVVIFVFEIVGYINMRMDADLSI